MSTLNLKGNEVMIKKINIQNVGPITALDIPLPDGGGVVVLRGENGAGKTSALEATQRVLGGNQQLSCRDGSPKGHVSGLGVKITVGRSTRRTGELEAVHLEGKLSIAELVDPGLKSDEAADAKRIKAMVAISGVTADEKLFREEIGEDMYCEAVNADKAGLDLLEMSARIKSDLHGYARRCESEATSKQGQANGFRQAAGDVPVKAIDEAALKNRLIEATQRKTQLQEARQTGEHLYDDAEVSRAELTKSGAPTPEQVQARRTASSAACKTLQTAKTALREAEQVESRAFAELSKIERQTTESVKHHKVIADYEAFKLPTGLQVLAAEKEATQASEVWDRAVIARDSRDKLARAEDYTRMALKAARQAVDARDAARACDTVLENAIRSDVLQVRDGRLYVSTDRGATLFAELSDGERWEIAIDQAAEVVGEGGLLVVPQSAWEGLDTTNRTLVSARAKERHVTIITAEAQREGESPELHADVVGAV